MRSMVVLGVSMWITLGAAHADPATHKVAFDRTDNSDGTAEYSKVGNPPASFVKGDTLVIECPGDCSTLIVRTKEGKDLKKYGEDGASPWTAVLPDAASILLSLGDISHELKRAAAGPPDPADVAPRTELAKLPVDTVLALVQPECPTRLDGPNQLVVDITGNVLDSTADDFTEGDKLTVWAVGPAAELAAVKIVRRSASRDVTVLRIRDAENVVTVSRKESGGVACKKVVLTNFSAGKGQLAIIGAGDRVLAEYELAVHPDYQGMFTVGFGWSYLAQPSFSLRDNGDATGSIVADPRGDWQVRYALMYTAFAPLHTWFPERLSARGWNQAVGLSGGVLLDDPTENILFGVTFGPLHGISLTAGRHWGKQRRLDGVARGDALPLESTIPTYRAWNSDWYIGAGFDFAVATKLLVSLFRAAGG